MGQDDLCTAICYQKPTCLPEVTYAYVASMLTGPNAIHPDRLTPEERLMEVAEILSSGLMRYRAKRQKLGGGEYQAPGPTALEGTPQAVPVQN